MIEIDVNKSKMPHIIGVLVVCGLSISRPCFAENAETGPIAGAKKTHRSADAEFAISSSTKFDFAEAAIDGKMKAPEGFFLQGRQGQQMSNLMNLRSNFRKELIGSAKAAESPQK